MLGSVPRASARVPAYITLNLELCGMRLRHRDKIEYSEVLFHHRLLSYACRHCGCPDSREPQRTALTSKTPSGKYSGFLGVLAEGDPKMSFDSIIGRNLPFQSLLDGYLTSYGLLCSQYLRKDKVEWTLPKCD